jgi:hypothetical protein
LSLNRNSLLALAACALTLSLTACGASPMASHATSALSVNRLVAKGVPPATAFVTITGTVVQVMPDDNSGLPHQKFIVLSNGQKLEVDNDTHYGTSVPGVAVGTTLTIRGVEYHDTGKSGIHWTHHANANGDAGFIKTADGHVYQ